LPPIGRGDGTSGITAAHWLARKTPATAVVYRTSSLVNQALAARAGIGVALLPCHLGDGDRGLERVLVDPVAELATELWMVTHRDLRNTARVRAFFEVVGRGISGEGSVLRTSRAIKAVAPPMSTAR
jgi:DNA-binding transcriptional LysR family regulator